MKVIILSGLPGSGKTTWARNNFPGALILSADDYFMVAGEYRFDPMKLGAAHAACQRKFMRHVVLWERDDEDDSCWESWPKATQDWVLIVDNTNTTITEIAPYAALALAYGHEMEIVSISCDPAKAAERNIHGVPPLVVGQMVQRLRDLQAQLPPWWPWRKVVAE